MHILQVLVRSAVYSHLVAVFSCNLMSSVQEFVWLYTYGYIFFILLATGSNYDAPLGIYRFSLTGPDSLLFNISGTIIPPNGTFANLEMIPYAEQLRPPYFDIIILFE